MNLFIKTAQPITQLTLCRATDSVVLVKGIHWVGPWGVGGTEMTLCLVRTVHVKSPLGHKNEAFSH